MTSKRSQRLAKLRAHRDARRERRAPGVSGPPSASTAANLVIGYVAHDGWRMACDGDACLVVGTRDKMRKILPRLGGRWNGEPQLEPARFGQIMQCLRMRAAYCLDEEAYGRFLQPAREVGLSLDDEDFSDPGPLGLHFVRIQYFGPWTPS